MTFIENPECLVDKTNFPPVKLASSLGISLRTSPLAVTERSPEMFGLDFAETASGHSKPMSPVSIRVISRPRPRSSIQS